MTSKSETLENSLKEWNEGQETNSEAECSTHEEVAVSNEEMKRKAVHSTIQYLKLVTSTIKKMK